MSKNAFEAHPKLAAYIEQIANLGVPGWSMQDWQGFTDAVNGAVAHAPGTPDLAFKRGAEAMRDECMSIIRTYRDHNPEEDETWESWYFAAFDLAIGRIKDLTSDEPIEDRNRRAEPSPSTAMTAPPADIETLGRVIDDTFEALGVTDNEAALVEIDRLKAAAIPPSSGNADAVSVPALVFDELRGLQTIANANNANVHAAATRILAALSTPTPSAAITDKPAAIEYSGIALAAHNRATPVAPDASTPVQRPHE